MRKSAKDAVMVASMAGINLEQADNDQKQVVLPSQIMNNELYSNNEAQRGQNSNILETPMVT